MGFMKKTKVEPMKADETGADSAAGAPGAGGDKKDKKGKKGKKGKKEKKEHDGNGVAPSSHRSCKDLLCTLAFVAFWVGMIIIALVGIAKGDAYKLLYGVDYNGDVCGKESFSDEKLVYFPRMNQDLTDSISSGTPPLETKFYGICVKECPTPGKFICDYDVQKKIDAGTTTAKDNYNSMWPNAGPCFKVGMETEPIFFRCMPKASSDANTTRLCVDPDGGFYGQVNEDNQMVTPTEQGKSFYEKRPISEVWDPSNNCDQVQVTKTTTSYDSGQENPLMDQLTDVISTIANWIGDITTTFTEVMICSLALPFVLGVLWIFLLGRFVTPMVWFTVYSVLAVCILLTLCLCSKAGMIGGGEFAALESTVAASGGEVSAAMKADEENKMVFEACAYIMIVVTLFIFMTIIFMRKKLKVAVGILREASKVLQAVPMLTLWPIVPYSMVCVLLGYFITIGAYIASASDVTVTDLTSTFPGNGTSVVNSTSFTGTKEMDIVTIMCFYHLFGLLWTNQVIQAISMCTIAGVTCQYYWNKGDKTKFGSMPIAKSFYTCIRYNFGSLVFGALIIAIVQMMRIILEFIDQKTKTLQDKNIVFKMILKAVKCYLWCLEKFVKFVSKQAYIIVAMKGYNFCGATVDAFKLLFANIAQLAITASISLFLILLSKLTITAACGILMFLWIDSNPEYARGGESELSSQMVPIMMVLLIAYFVARTFLEVYGMCVDTLLLCFCEDKKKNKEGSYFMSEELQRAIGAKVSKNKDGDAGGADAGDAGAGDQVQAIEPAAKPDEVQSINEKPDAAGSVEAW
jgi:choline transporter-like protein 2/4/5